MPYFCRNFFLTDWRHKRLKNTIDLCYFTENTSTDFRKVKCWNSLLRQINFHELPKYFSNFQMLTLISKFQNWKIFLMKNSQKLGTLFGLLARQFEKWHVFGTLARLLARWHVDHAGTHGTHGTRFSKLSFILTSKSPKKRKFFYLSLYRSERRFKHTTWCVVLTLLEFSKKFSRTQDYNIRVTTKIVHYP